MPRNKSAVCTKCGERCHRSESKGVHYPVGEHRCFACRRKYSGRCACGEPKTPRSTRCLGCHFASLRSTARSSPRSVWISPAGANISNSRWQRLRAAVLIEEPTCRIGLPGVCTVVSDTVDHIVPRSKDPTLTMVRSNLRGACRACNSALGNGGVKGLHLRIWPPCLAFVVAEPEPLPPRPDCRICGSSVVGHRGRKYCSEACRVEANARYQRDRYRAAQCLPVDSSKPTKPFERRRLWLDVDQHRKIPVSAAG